MTKIGNRLRVSELFYSIQGEGPTTGKPAYFLRLTGCNLMCGGWGTQKDKQLHDGATWRCDSIEVWLRGKLLTFQEVYQQLVALGFKTGDRLIITGGEPLLMQDNIVAFTDYLYQEGRLKQLHIEIETNGTIQPSIALKDRVSQFNVSPKLANSGMSFVERFNGDALHSILVSRSSVAFKFVVGSDADIQEVEEAFIEPLNIPKYMVWLMPAADNKEQLNATLPWLAEVCKAKKYNLSNRLHIEIWDAKTGV